MYKTTHFLPFALVSMYALYRYYRHKPKPPGPIGWPLIGYIKILSPDMYLQLQKLGSRYGNVFSFYLGNRLAVVLNDYKSLREAFLNHSVTFAGRPFPWVLKCVDVKEEINNGTYSEEWIEHKKFVLTAMKKFGYGTSSGLDNRIQHEISTLMHIYSQSKQINPRDHLNRAMASLIFSILINTKYGYESPELEEKLSIIQEWQGMVANANILDLFPLLRFVPFKPIQKLREIGQRMKGIYGRDIEKHKQTYSDNNCRDVIDVFLKQKGHDFSTDRLIGLFVGFAGDAADTLPEAMVWLVLYLTHYHEIQKQIQAEVDKIGVPVTPSHRTLLPLTEAFVMEGLRLSTFVPITEPHTVLHDVIFNDYLIPKDSLVLGNIYACHMDKDYWGDPHQFRPQRFLNKDGKLIKHNAFMAFSVGRRSCIGEQLSMKVLIQYIASLMQQFTLTFPSESPGLDPPTGFVRKAKQFEFIAIPR